MSLVTNAAKAAAHNQFAMGILKSGLSALGQVGKVAIGKGPGRIALGAGIGLAYGLANADWNSPRSLVGHAVRGATTGAGIGLASRAITPAIYKQRNLEGEMEWTTSWANRSRSTSGSTSSIIGSSGRSLFKGLGSVGSALKTQGGGALKMANLALDYPMATIGIAGAGYMATQEPDMPNLFKVTRVRQDEAGDQQRLANIANSPMSANVVGTGSRKAFMESTYGLVQGLHRSRH